MLGVDPDLLVKLGNEERERFIVTTYEALVNWVISKANSAIESEFQSKKEAESSDGSEGDTVAISLIEQPDEIQAKALCLRLIFDDDMGINAEMK